jgi:hypothetical protein
LDHSALGSMAVMVSSVTERQANQAPKANWRGTGPCQARGQFEPSAHAQDWPSSASRLAYC